MESWWVRRERVRKQGPEMAMQRKAMEKKLAKGENRTHMM
jgi:hypothetical protein